MAGRVIARELAEAWRPAALALVEEVTARGLVADVMGHGTVRVENPAGGPEEGNSLGQLMHPGLRQEIACRHRDGVLWWWWVWSGPTRRSPHELEPLCPISDVQTAADRLARVLAVSSVESPDGGV
ncbi:hypothetical protein ACFHW2_21320 [Actinomadura sp. LOL_016]|uniref:hypothetical protein n=1 Tax=unclassified Actinomadura TaxID=2626254 RepID=UPI003A806D83